MIMIITIIIITILSSRIGPIEYLLLLSPFGIYILAKILLLLSWSLCNWNVRAAAAVRRPWFGSMGAGWCSAAGPVQVGLSVVEFLFMKIATSDFGP